MAEFLFNADVNTRTRKKDFEFIIRKWLTEAVYQLRKTI